ncbi:MAG: FkbM family methyltransferase [Chloroflexi bacterium]|nr:FkbM family methyltransferase [Chloroflexota bacterium]
MSFAEFVYTEVLKPRPLRALTNAVLLRIIPEKLSIGSATLYLNPNDPVLSGALTLRVYEHSELHFFQEYCRDDMVLVDVGANIGLYSSLAIHTLNSKGRIIALEPHPESHALLQKNVRTNIEQRGTDQAPRVDMFMLAASAENGTRHLSMNPDNKADNRLSDAPENWQSVSVEARSLDALLAEAGIEQVNFVKMDVQGYEQNVLAGFKETLRRSEQVILMTEFWPKGLHAAGGDARTYLQTLADLGFTLYELIEKPRGKIVPLEAWDSLITRLPGRKYTNLIAVKGYPLE